MIDNWVQRKLPNRLERRIEFASYDLTREFLDLAADKSEKEGYYPDLTFGKHHVNMTIYVDEDLGEPDESQVRFAIYINSITSNNDVVEEIRSVDTPEEV